MLCFHVLSLVISILDPPVLLHGHCCISTVSPGLRSVPLPHSNTCQAPLNKDLMSCPQTLGSLQSLLLQTPLLPPGSLEDAFVLEAVLWVTLTGTVVSPLGTET